MIRCVNWLHKQVSASLHAKGRRGWFMMSREMSRSFGICWLSRKFSPKTQVFKALILNGHFKLGFVEVIIGTVTQLMDQSIDGLVILLALLESGRNYEVPGCGRKQIPGKVPGRANLVSSPLLPLLLCFFHFPCPLSFSCLLVRWVVPSTICCSLHYGEFLNLP